MSNTVEAMWSRTADFLGFGWYPALLAAAWFLEIWVNARVEPAAVGRALAVTMALALLVTLLPTLLMGPERGALTGAAAVAVLIGASTPLMLVPIVAVIPLLMIERRWASAGRVRLPWRAVHEWLSVAAVVMLVIQLARAVAIDQPAPLIDPGTWGRVEPASTPRHDIFVVLADGHGRADILRQWYDYDSGHFDEALASLGFEVAAGSRANYMATRFSLASMFTGSYLDGLHGGRSAADADAIAGITIRDNPLFPLLRSAGYEVVVVSSGYEHLRLRSADVFIDTGQPNEMERILLSNTLVGRLLSADPSLPTLSTVRERTRAELDLLPTLGETHAQPARFVFMHLPVPHWPYAFDADCGPARADIGADAEDTHPGAQVLARAISEQTACVDSMLVEALGKLVALNPDAVVVVLADHGPQEPLDKLAPTDVALRKRSSILFAARTPAHPGLFPDDISLVNVFPVLLNAYLGTDLPMRPTRVWLGPRPPVNGFVPVDWDRPNLPCLPGRCG